MLSSYRGVPRTSPLPRVNSWRSDDATGPAERAQRGHDLTQIDFSIATPVREVQFGVGELARRGVRRVGKNRDRYGYRSACGVQRVLLGTLCGCGSFTTRGTHHTQSRRTHGHASPAEASPTLLRSRDSARLARPVPVAAGGCASRSGDACTCQECHPPTARRGTMDPDRRRAADPPSASVLQLREPPRRRLGGSFDDSEIQQSG
jgi:hypothetical protein